MNQCLLKKAVAGVLDYGQVMSCLQSYKAPHRKITELLRKGDLIRIKKGIYVLSAQYRQMPVVRELLANLIFGPSYISQEFALAFYGLIPERVDCVTSMTTKRKKRFDTPMGMFQYDYLNTTRFSVGVEWVQVRDNVSVLIASREKALVDAVAKFPEIETTATMQEHLLENLRIDRDELSFLNIERLEKITKVYQKPIINVLLKTLQGVQYG